VKGIVMADDRKKSKTYAIIRFFPDGHHAVETKVIKTGLTLEQAKEQLENTADWHDGYVEE
jgi:hypothetical protein